MDYKDAFKTLEIDYVNIKCETLTIDYITKRYRKMALKYHPDKNGNTEESTEKFKKINESYTYLKNVLKTTRPYAETDTESTNDTCDDSHTIYLTVLHNFINSVMDGNCIDIITKIVKTLLSSGTKMSIKIFEDLDKDTSLQVYIFLSRYKTTLHLNDDLLDSIMKIVLTKYDNVMIYKLNPSINDIMDNNLYKLYVNDVLYLVPLWHNESYYDNSGCEIIVMCDPDLPDNIKIDDDNNLLVDIIINANDMILNDKPISFDIGNKNYKINLSKLNMVKEQYYYLKGQGLTKLKKNILDISGKTDIIIKIVCEI